MAKRGPVAPRAFSLTLLLCAALLTVSGYATAAGIADALGK